MPLSKSCINNHLELSNDSFILSLVRTEVHDDYGARYYFGHFGHTMILVEYLQEEKHFIEGYHLVPDSKTPMGQIFWRNPDTLACLKRAVPKVQSREIDLHTDFLIAKWHTAHTFLKKLQNYHLELSTASKADPLDFPLETLCLDETIDDKFFRTNEKKSVESMVENAIYQVAQYHQTLEAYRNFLISTHNHAFFKNKTPPNIPLYDDLQKNRFFPYDLSKDPGDFGLANKRLRIKEAIQPYSHQLPMEQLPVFHQIISDYEAAIDRGEMKFHARPSGENCYNCTTFAIELLEKLNVKLPDHFKGAWLPTQVAPDISTFHTCTIS